jgi:UDP-glucose 4-epimerase
LSPYSWSKAKNIELIKNFQRWFGLRYEIVYFYNVYGDRQIKNHPMAALIGIFEEQYRSGLPLTVVMPGTQKRDFTNVKDIVYGTFLAWKKNLNDEFLLGTGKNYSILEVAKMFGGEIRYIPERPGERLASIIENNNAQKMLGYEPKESLEDYISLFKKSVNRNN